MDRELVQLSKEISRALRHTPWYYELELDSEGWVPLDDLLASIARLRPRWRDVSEKEVQQIIEESDKRRFEIVDGRIRAFYGHSVPLRLQKQPATPPAILYHGTASQTVKIIQEQGLKPMRRQYVHLSADEPTALQVARRKGSHPVILRVRAGEASRNNITFYNGNEMVWLADFVPPEFIDLPPEVRLK
ncbi:MAG TPA: RNA 2'-phosphotransferase [Chloroflexia bacterium]|nr:RNA 2'-phosphotransferase [Chloroflexia bacterium]